MDFLLFFVLAFLISAVGSIPPGLITLTILRSSVQNGRRDGLWISVGALIPEFIYTYLALVGYRYLQQNPFATAVFLLFGIYYLLKKVNPQTLEFAVEREAKNGASGFSRGLGIGFLNMLIVPFWVFVAGWLSMYDMAFEDLGLIISFCLGAAIGAGVVFWGYVELGNWLVNRLGRIEYYTNKVVGGIFLGLGLLQLI